MIKRINKKSSFNLWLLSIASLESNFSISHFLNLRMIQTSSFREQLWMIIVRSWMFHHSIWKSHWNDINDLEWHFSVQTVPELHYTFHFSMNSMILANIHILSRFPLEPSLSGNNITRIDLLTTKLLQSVIYYNKNTLISYQQNLECFVLMMLAF